ncbi:hypothetical protein PPYR_02890 [Photinus pyralis]|uniref:Cytochrome P450 n=1 Tax=Photinus pyralis TaxID=7054 RepID=A0A1Y1KK07_PHOPY|nr:probable cytochrome P450 6a14 [Photinus pyralis]XP_031331651.1 probable cytochrome P450 6a14 [Photinus pyralis]KAB0791090.1 hypothetical protein PPYR_02890 [Photinus pyralis]
MWITLLIYIVTFAIAIVAYFKWSFGYWKKLGVPYLESSIPFGTMNNPLTLSESIADNVARQYKESKALGYKYVGLYGLTMPQFMVIDPELLKCVMIKDFHHFTDRGFYFNEKDDPLSAHLFTLTGQKWRRLRAKLTPTFTSAKMRTMNEFVVACGYQLRDALGVRCTQGPIEIKDLLERYTTNIIGSCAFGIECNSFTDPNNEFCMWTRKQFHPTAFQNFKMFISFMFPGFAEMIRMKVVTDGVTNFFMKTVRESIALRRKTGQVRNDFLQILIGLMEESDGMTLEEVAAQAFLFFLAGFETSSSTMSFCLYELSLNPDIQQRVRDEINAVLKKYNGEITYDSLRELEYMSCVIDEVLRKYPPVPILNRKCVSDYKLPNTDITIKKGVNLVIPLIGLQRDPDYFPNPDKFDPERFNKKNVEKVTPFSYMPFGEGLRICLGLRFGLMQTKIGLLLMLKNFKFTLSDKTATPIELNPICFVLSVQGGIWLNAEKVAQ